MPGLYFGQKIINGFGFEPEVAQAIAKEMGEELQSFFSKMG